MNDAEVEINGILIRGDADALWEILAGEYEMRIVEESFHSDTHILYLKTVGLVAPLRRPLPRSCCYSPPAHRNDDRLPVATEPNYRIHPSSSSRDARTGRSESHGSSYVVSITYGMTFSRAGAAEFLGYNRRRRAGPVMLVVRPLRVVKPTQP
jgi:hypothetical protein